VDECARKRGVAHAQDVCASIISKRRDGRGSDEKHGRFRLCVSRIDIGCVYVVMINFLVVGFFDYDNHHAYISASTLMHSPCINTDAGDGNVSH
jgi:hypothetical protein